MRLQSQRWFVRSNKVLSRKDTFIVTANSDQLDNPSNEIPDQDDLDRITLTILLIADPNIFAMMMVAALKQAAEDTTDYIEDVRSRLLGATGYNSESYTVASPAGVIPLLPALEFFGGILGVIGWNYGEIDEVLIDRLRPAYLRQLIKNEPSLAELIEEGV